MQPRLPPPGLEEPGRDWRARVARLTPSRAAELARRARQAPLFAHAYAFHLDFRFGGLGPAGLLDFAAGHGLAGVKIHVHDGEERCLAAMDTPSRRAFGEKARALGLDVHVETSTTERAGLAEAAAVAHETGASALRCYPRYEGRVSDIVRRVAADLKGFDALDPDGRLRLLLEQHEDLRSEELVGIVEAVGSPRLSLLFDFGNMINAFERPLEALAVQAPHVTDVHVKDCLVLPDRGGWAHEACTSGAGHLPMEALLVELLLLGEDRPQVVAFGLEEEEDYLAPAFRFPGEEADPWIPARSPSFTDPGAGPLAERLAREREAAVAQLRTVRGMLSAIAEAAEGRARESQGAGA